MKANNSPTNSWSITERGKDIHELNHMGFTWKCHHMCIMVMGMLIATCCLSSCSKDSDDDPAENGSELNVVVDNNGVANGGHSFTRIDDKNFIIDDIKYTIVDSVLEVTGYDETFFKGEARIISSLNYHETLLKVKSIGANAFNSCVLLTTIYIPHNITSIGSSAFKDCKELKIISISGDGLISIGSSAFYGCESLTSFPLPNSVASIGSNTFTGCSNLKTIVVPSSVITIGSKAFADCTGITSISIGDGVTEIGSKVFSGCYNLRTITLGKSLTSIPKDAFYDCDYLQSVVVASENIKYDSRENCNAIIETASNTLVWGFNCSSIPNGVETIGVSAFYNCRMLSFITIPNSVTTIEKNAFQYCTALTSVNIPDGVSKINENAFDGCNKLTTAYIGNGVKFIDLSAFLGCSNLTDIYCYATTPPSHVYSTKYWSKIGTVTLHVPTESVNAYNRFPWELFRTIVAI